MKGISAEQVKKLVADLEQLAAEAEAEAERPSAKHGTEQAVYHGIATGYQLSAVRLENELLKANFFNIEGR